MLFDIKEIKNVIQQIAESRQLSEDSLWAAIESAFAAAYKREYCKSDQIVRARINKDTGETSFFQIKLVLDDSGILPEDEDPVEDETRIRFNPERHMLVKDAQLVRQGAEAGEEMIFELEEKGDFSRIAAQSARQAVTQKIHEAERDAAMSEFEGKEGTLVVGQVQRIERGNIYVDLGRTVAILPFEEQIRGERFRQGENIRAYVLSIDTSRRSGGFVKLSRAHPQFVVSLFALEVPELIDGVIEVKAVSREPGMRTKIAAISNDESIDPIGSFIGQRGVRVMSVKSELGGEQIDIIHYSENIDDFVGEALLPAEVFDVSVGSDDVMIVKVNDDQIPIAIGRGGQNLRLAAELTGRTIELYSTSGEKSARCEPNGEIEVWKSKERLAEEEKERAEKDAKRNAEMEGSGSDDGVANDDGAGGEKEVADGEKEVAGGEKDGADGEKDGADGEKDGADGEKVADVTEEKKKDVAEVTEVADEKKEEEVSDAQKSE